MFENLLVALSLVMVIEGVLPFLSPEKWREFMTLMAQQSDQSIRMMGAVSMGIGVILLMLVRN
ncbi:MAG: DUF2065 domain-containing protein [bacterium]